MKTTEKDPVTGKPAKATPKKQSKFVRAIKETLRVILILLIMSTIGSYLVTGDLMWGYKLPNFRKKIQTKFLTNERILTPEELAQYDGSDPEKPLYLAIDGHVFDVTSGASHYGKGGSYHTFVGRDATRAFITGCFTTHLTHDLRGFTEDQLKSLEEWKQFYFDHEKYTYIGRVKHDPIDPKSPIPKDCDSSS